MVRDALLGNADKIILISADTDYIPALKIIKEEKPEVEIEIRLPSGQYTSDKYKELVSRDLITTIKLKHDLIAQCQFKDKDHLRPAKYKPIQ